MCFQGSLVPMSILFTGLKMQVTTEPLLLGELVNGSQTAIQNQAPLC